MTKYEPYSRRELRIRRMHWLHKKVRLLVALALGTLALLVLVTAVLAALPGAMHWYALGAAHVAVIAAVLHLLNSAFLAHEAEAIWHVRGAWGEENTRSELQRAKRRRLIWGWVDSINLQFGDLDHVVVTRSGGVVAIDSKWRNAIASDDITAMTRAALVAKSRTEAVTRTVLSTERRARHRARVGPVVVTPIVVVWGAAQGTVPSEAQVDGVRFVRGRELVSWLRSFEGDAVPRYAARELLKCLRGFRARSWDERPSALATKRGAGHGAQRDA